MGQFAPAVDAYISRQQPFARPILTHLRAVVHAACPEVTEGIKWGMPCFDHHGLLCNMAAFKAHAAFGFWKEKLLRDQQAGLPAPAVAAMGSFGRLTSVRDLPAKAVLLKLVRAAMRLNEAGVPRAPKAPARASTAVHPPAWFMARVRANRKALATWTGFAPGHRREYLAWVTEAKTAPTRERRLATTVAWLAEGKRHNWRYASKRPAAARAPRRQKP